MASLLRTDKEITEIYHRQIDTVYRICYSFMKNKPEAEDMVQETFLRLIASGKTSGTKKRGSSLRHPICARIS